MTMAAEMTANSDEDKSMQKSTEGHDNNNSKSHKEGEDKKVTRMVTMVTKVDASMANSNEDRA